MMLLYLCFIGCLSPGTVSVALPHLYAVAALRCVIFDNNKKAACLKTAGSFLGIALAVLTAGFNY